MAKAFPARYPGTCPECRQKIQQGDSIMRGTARRWVHESCQESAMLAAEVDVDRLIDELLAGT